MPRLRLHPGAQPFERAKEPESGGMSLEPLIEALEWAAGRKLLARKFDLIAVSGSAAVDEIEISTPVMTAGAGQRRPLPVRLTGRGDVGPILFSCV